MFSLVLQRRDFREFDQIITVFTKEYGKKDLLGKGLKKISSKNSAHLEPFSYVDLEVAHGKEVDYVTRVIPINIFLNIRSDYKKSALILGLLKLMDIFTEENNPDEKIFQLFLSWLIFLEKNDGSELILGDALVVKLLSCLGYEPRLDSCAACAKSYKEIVARELGSSGEFSKPGFSFSAGGILCQDCFVEKRKVENNLVSFGIKLIADLSMLINNDWNVIRNFPGSSEDKINLHKFIFEFAMYHTEKKLPDYGEWFLAS